MKLPLTLPLDNYVPRRTSVQNLGDVIGGRGQHFVVIELQTPAEVTAVSDWIADRRPVPPYGGPV